MELERIGGTQARRRGLAAGAARRRQLDPAQARGHGRPDPGGHRRSRTCSTWPAICSPATASRPGCSPSISAPPTGGSSTTSTACCAPATFADPVRLPGRDADSGSVRSGARAVAADRRATPGTTSWSRATGSTTACCTIPSTTAARPRACSTSPRAASRFPRTSSRVPLATYLRLLQEALRPPAELTAPAVHRELARAGRDHGLAAAAAAGVPRRSRRSRRRSAWRCGSSCPAAWSPTWTSWRASSATPAIPYLPGERRRARRRPLDRPQRLRDPRAAPHPAAARRTSACRT